MEPYTNPIEFKQSGRYRQFVEMGLTGVQLDHACHTMVKLINWYLRNTHIGEIRKVKFLSMGPFSGYAMRQRWERATGLSVEYRDKLSAGVNPYV